MSGLTALDGSQLCLACGLCCQGVLHAWAKIRDSEIETAQQLGLCTATHPLGPVFALPCPLHQGNRCTVYEERPSPCLSYRCKLLRRYLSGEVAWEEALRRVSQVKQLVAALRSRLDGPEADQSVWQQLRHYAQATGRVDDRDLQMEAAALLALCQQHFLNRAEPVEILGA